MAIPIAGLMKSMGATQEERHLDVIMDRLETERWSFFALSKFDHIFKISKNDRNNYRMMNE